MSAGPAKVRSPVGPALGALGQTLRIARRELVATLRSPVALAVGVLFLVVEGFSFWAVLAALADPRRPTPVGAVLRTHFGGTFLYWAFLFFVVAITTMRLIAEERRQGTWETLLTAPVGEGSVVVGKWLGALGFYALLWAPTLAYVVVLRAFAPPGAAPDLGPITSAYLGVLVTGAAFLAVGVAASAATSSQVVAAQVTFAALILLLLAGLTPELAPGIFADHPTLLAAARAIDVRRHMDDFARGVVDSRHLALHGGLAGGALVLAFALAGVGRRARGAGARAALGVALVIAAVLLGNVLAGRHPVRLDLTRARVYTLEPRTRRILSEIDRPVGVLVLGAGAPEFAELFDEVRELLRAFQAAQPLLTVQELDPTADPGRIGELAEANRLAPEELTGGGAVVFTADGRRRAVALLDMAEFTAGAQGGAMASFRGEAEFAAALLAVTGGDRPEVCFTTGHGEIPLAAAAGGGRDLAVVVGLLAEDAVRATDLPELAAGVPGHCRAVAIVGPQGAFAATEAMALHRFLGSGGRLLLAVDPELRSGGERLLPTGLETVLAERGVRLPPAVVMDPSFEIGVPLAWASLRGYGDHPVAGAFQGRRATVWYEPRWVEAVEMPGARVTALVSSSPVGWGETDLAGLRSHAPRAADGQDVPGPLAVAVAAEQESEGSRLVVIGSARSFSSEVVARQTGVNDAFFTSAIAWLTGREGLTGVRPKTPEQFRVVMTTAQVRRVFLSLVVLLPGLLAAVFGVLAWRRGRES